jgi:multimeric flavodoxin WrbA
MRIVSLIGSPHGLKGNTAALLGHLHEGAQAEGAIAEVIVLRGDSVSPCLGCDVCHIKGLCVQKDDFEEIKTRITAADGLVLASPNYIFNVSAQMKAFMDRCCGIIHCMGFWGKYGASVVTSGGGDEEPIAGYMNHFLMTTGIVPVGSVWADMASTHNGTFSQGIRDKARKLGKELVEAWRAGDVPAGVDEQRNSFRKRMQSLIAYRSEEWPFEYRHWQEKMDL